MTGYDRYMEDVLNGRIVVGEYVRLSVERHARDLERSHRGEIPYFFHAGYAAHAVSFIRKMRHTKGIMANKLFDLQPFQEFLCAVMFGWLGPHPDTGTIGRRFTKVYNEVARKNGKTELMAAVGNYGLIADGEAGAEIYAAATKLPQARIVFNASKSMLNKFKREYKAISPDITVMKDRVVYMPTESMYEPLPADSDKLDGLNPHMGLVDELHAHPDDKLFKVLETGMGARTQPLMLIITTAGFNIYGICYAVRKTNIDILRGIKQDDRSFSMIYALDEADDWEDEAHWIKANPNVGRSIYWSYLRDQYQKAITEGATAEGQFKTKNLNIWTKAGKSWIKDEDWMASGTRWDTDMLNGRQCFVGMDLSTNIDLTALVYVFPPIESDYKFRVFCRFYCPEDNIDKRAKADGVPYEQWVGKGYLTATPGRVVDYEYLLNALREDRQRFDIQVVEYDKAFAWKLAESIKELGLNISEYKQNRAEFNSPIMEIEKLILNRQLDHGRHPILRWCISNVALKHDSGGRVMFDKLKATERIDGAVALAMAVGGYLTDDAPKPSIYESNDIVGL